MNESNGKGNWSKVAEECRNRYNETNHSVTGFSPKYLLSGESTDLLPNELKERQLLTKSLEEDRKVALKRYVVWLPLRSDRPQLGESKQLALKRFYSLEKRLQCNESLREKYIAFMREYINLNHMSLYEGSLDNLSESEHYIIPHHGIFKSGADKIRVVFDASSPTSSGVSLNDCLHSGEKLQKDIISIICNFRLYSVVFTTDIRMMFRQIVVYKDDQMYQLIFWREAPELPLRLYKLHTITYGMRSSPFLAIRVLNQLSNDEDAKYPAAARLLRSSVYMDDILGGAHTEAEAKQLMLDLTKLLSSAGFELRKWTSNNAELLSDIPRDHLEKPHVFDNADGISYIKILGIQWNSSTDRFTYHLNLPKDSNCTKRTILSALARTYDPLGWIAPVILQGKLLMQRLWALGIDWDVDPPQEIVKTWNSILSNLTFIENIKIERYYLLNEIQHCSLHGFADASEAGYGAAVYLRVVDSSGRVKLSLMMAKSRVAPIKTKLTIPKLELCGAALVTKILDNVFYSIRDNVEIHDMVCWTDSTIVLSWLQTPPHLLQTFEGNRLSYN
ncbi:hypothetical protein EVAR_32277_1 [Eumeta japonica]|uniref:Reverse transcriptase domain-containing protein n=1 Tax=Eumeta variegata TaxID=151549 RepID=A0A4C1WD23_EUMVA|nr:hypothetical protein EVAR_32277_1 [Eumeta japonica]